MSFCINTFILLQEAIQQYKLSYILDKLFIHKGTFIRWVQKQEVPENYFNDLNALLGNKYPSKTGVRVQDQFFTTEKTARYCYNKMLSVLKDLEVNEEEYTFIEPSAGCCNFYKILPENRRIGIDIEPKGELKNELIKISYLDFMPEDKAKKYIVIGNPPFGLRGNLAFSAFTSDTQSPKLEDTVHDPWAAAFDAKYTSLMRIAGDISANITLPNFNTSVFYRMVQPDYTTLGMYYTSNNY